MACFDLAFSNFWTSGSSKSRPPKILDLFLGGSSAESDGLNLSVRAEKKLEKDFKIFFKVRVSRLPVVNNCWATKINTKFNYLFPRHLLSENNGEGGLYFLDEMEMKMLYLTNILKFLTLVDAATNQLRKWQQMTAKFN